MRQGRLLAEMRRFGIGLVVLSRPESVQWLTGARFASPFWGVAAVDDGGVVTLVAPSRRAGEPFAADKVLAYEEKRLSSTRDVSDQVVAALGVLFDNLASAPSRAGCEFTAAPMPLASALPERPLDFDPILFRLRRRKEADELELLRRANDANRAMYEAARRVVRPGVNELDVFAELQRAAARELGETLTYLGQDFRCGARGGTARDRLCEAGELYILDLGVGFRGYHSDNARTLAVGGDPTEDQLRAWRMVRDALRAFESLAKPGVSCSQLYEAARMVLAPAAPWRFDHHLGHGVGLAPQEAPRLNPNWNDTLEVGDYLAVEPGLYHESLRFGVRLEQNYVVTETGIELLTDWPLELV